MSVELVASGWYSSIEPPSYITAGDDLIRGVGFRPLWWRSMDSFIKPRHVFIVDSASPVKPNDAAHTATPFQHTELLINPGHSQNGKTHYCGFMASVILGLEFALHNDVDMFLYVEQDALVFGDSIVAKTKSALRRKDLVFGAGVARDIQQSFFAANKKGIRRFLSALHAIDYSDKQVAPEHKFMFAASRALPGAMIKLAEYTEIPKLRSAGVRLFDGICRLSRNYALLPFGYGRARPINFGDDAFYFQHGSAEELSQYRKRTGF
ncbi:MAG: hypothetical protein M3N97_07605 [Pseudomonadota bacterium]|nr:hypothetical protein [Pseudomonadota bacterium]